MNTSGLLQRKCETLRALLTLQETGSIHDSMNIPKIELISLLTTSLLFAVKTVYYDKCSKISNTLKLQTPKIIAENNF